MTQSMKKIDLLCTPDAILRNADTCLNVGIQKSGRLYEQSMQFFQANGIDIGFARNGYYESKNATMRFYFLREKDIPRLVQNGPLDMGIVGMNTYCESNMGNLEYRLGFCACRMVLAVPETSFVQNPRDLNGAKITTSYPRILKNYLQQQNITDVTIETYDGSIETIATMNQSDAIFDIVETGNSLRENNFRELQDIMSSEAVLISGTSLNAVIAQQQRENITERFQLVY